MAEDRRLRQTTATRDNGPISDSNGHSVQLEWNGSGSHGNRADIKMDHAREPSKSQVQVIHETCGNITVKDDNRSPDISNSNQTNHGERVNDFNSKNHPHDELPSYELGQKKNEEPSEEPLTASSLAQNLMNVNTIPTSVHRGISESTAGDTTVKSEASKQLVDDDGIISNDIGKYEESEESNVPLQIHTFKNEHNRDKSDQKSDKLNLQPDVHILRSNKLDIVGVVDGEEKRDKMNEAVSPGVPLDMEALEVMPDVSPYWIVCWIQQFRVIMKKNFIIYSRHGFTTFSQSILAPLIFMSLLFILQQIDYSNQRQSQLNPASTILNGLSECQGNSGPGSPCISIMYCVPPRHTFYEGSFLERTKYFEFMEAFSQGNARRGGPQFSIEPKMLMDINFEPNQTMGIIQVPTREFIYQYVLLHPNTTVFGIIFDNTDKVTLNVQYQIWYNSTLLKTRQDLYGRDLLRIMRGLDEAIISRLNSPNASVFANMNVTIKDWPQIPASVLSDTIVQSLGPIFFFCTVMVIFINTMNQIVHEKEQKLRLAMEMIGLKSTVYWLAQFTSTSILILISSLTTTSLGYMMKFEAFVQTNPLILVITFFMFGESMIAFAMFLTTLIRTSQIAVLVGIFIFIIGLMFESFVFSSNYFGYVWWSPPAPGFVRNLLVLIPFFNFGKLFLDITTYTTGKLDPLTSTYIPGPGFNFTTLTAPLPIDLRPDYGGTGVIPDVPPPSDSIKFMLMNICVYFVLTLYFDRVIPSEFGYAEKPWFFLIPEYWGLKFKQNKNWMYSDWLFFLRRNADESIDLSEDVDILKVRMSVIDKQEPAAIRILNLRKIYKNGWLYKHLDKVAVKNLSLTLEEGQIFALLGQNGAGKSTTMNILSGLTPSTSGDALMYGHSVSHHMPSIRSLLGVCPQYDILFEDLTAREHIELYAGLKGIPRRFWGGLTRELLKAVHLESVGYRTAGVFSGGMKRRLSLIISAIGNPKIIFMDEPTTGMDPINRRHVWSFIQKLKHGRVIVLTTHSMEEADHLGDRIGVMAKGSLRAIGTSSALKKKYGCGYRVTMMLDTTVLNDREGYIPLLKHMSRLSMQQDEEKGGEKGKEETVLKKVQSVVDGHLKQIDRLLKEGGVRHGEGDEDINMGITIDHQNQNMDSIMADIMKCIPGAILEGSNAGTLVYLIPEEGVEGIPELLRFLGACESGRRGKILKGWGISETTLEEVFLKLIRDDFKSSKTSLVSN